MTITGNKVLMIWPPVVTSRLLPLGIPFLVAYLRNHGLHNIDVFDMNTAYLKETRSTWFSYTLVKRACRIFENNIRKAPDKKNPLYEYLLQKKSQIADEFGSQEKASIPWSLRSILAMTSDERMDTLREKARRLLAAVMNCSDVPLVCISVEYPEQLFFSFVIAREFKQKFGDRAVVVLGGAQVTKHIDYLKKSPETYVLVDFLVIGDGEEALLKLMGVPERTPFSDIPNLYARDADKREGYVSSGKTFFLDPTDYPLPCFDGFDLGEYEDQIPLIVTKGCLWGRCTFCSYAGMQNRKFRSGPVGKALTLVNRLKERHGADDFIFVDDAVPPRFMELFAQGLLNEKLDIRWSVSIILHQVFKNPAFCQLLKSAGLNSVSIGLESFVPRILSLMNKYQHRLSESEIKEVLLCFKEAGIKVQLSVFFGFPTETFQEAYTTLDFLLKHTELYDFVAVQPFCLEEQSLISEEPERFGISKIYRQDKNIGRRLGYSFEVKEGMNQQETWRFVDDAVALLTQALREKSKKRK
jgi:radical SAM superfamily enzyme YgiQ (UPF0313 family)